MEKIKGIKKIISLGPHELDASDLSIGYKEPYIGKIKADVLIYAYEDYGYDGSGVAVWRNNGEWSYQYLGHCSCDGPTEDIHNADKAKFSLEEIKNILSSKENSWCGHYTTVATYLARYK